MANFSTKFSFDVNHPVPAVGENGFGPVSDPRIETMDTQEYMIPSFSPAPSLTVTPTSISSSLSAWPTQVTWGVEASPPSVPSWSGWGASRKRAREDDRMDNQRMDDDLMEMDDEITEGENPWTVWNAGPRNPPRRNPRRNATSNNSNLDPDFFNDIFGLDSNSDDERPPSRRRRRGGCQNPECDHEDYTTEERERGEHLRKTPPVTEVRDIEDLITLGKSYHCKKNTHFNQLDLQILFRLIVPLCELRDLVGMEKVKRDLVNQIIFFLQGFNKQTRCNMCIDCSFERPCKQTNNNDMLHTVITGPPGVGKSELGRILGHVYRAMGVLKKGHMKVVKRSDLIGKYLGHTAAKTQAVIDQARGGVLFIDEAYSLGNKEGRDSFSKECLDTLNQNLTERRDFLCIIAGYRDALDKCFFAYNEGLKRRFSFRYDIEGYGPEELRDIFLIKVKKNGWEFESVPQKGDDEETLSRKKELQTQLTHFFVDHHSFFPHFGGDVETLFLNCKIYHGRRVLLLEQNTKKVLTLTDVRRGFEGFVEDRRGSKTATEKDRMFYSH